MAAWGDEKSHVRRWDAAAAASRCSLHFQTRLMRRAPRHGGQESTQSEQNGSRVLFFVRFSKRAVHVDGAAAQQMLCVVLILMPVLIFHFSGAERGSLIPAFTNNSSTDSWRGLPTRRSQMRKSSALRTSTLIDQQHHHLCERRHLCSEAATLRRPRSPFRRSPCIETIMGL